MTKLEVIDLLEKISGIYPNFTVDEKIVNGWHWVLENESYENMLENLKKHAKDSRYAPTPADLLAYGGFKKTRDQIEHERMLKEMQND